MVASPTLRPLSFSHLRGFYTHNFTPAFVAFQDSCRNEIKQRVLPRRAIPFFSGNTHAFKKICMEALKINHPSSHQSRLFFERHFQAFEVQAPSALLTGYYEAEAWGSKTRKGIFQVPLYLPPPSQHERLSLTREEIEKGALSNRGLEFVWLSSWVDAFFIHIQGSGRIKLDDGSSLRVVFQGKNGFPYTSVGKILKERGILKPGEISMQTIRAWMEKHAEEARSLMWENRSFIFFSPAPLHTFKKGPRVSSGVPLTPLRSIAVDRRFWPLGTPFWLEAPLPDSISPTFRSLVIAQDTGSAILGPKRADLFCGHGARAAFLAGHLQEKHFKMVVFLPKK